MFWQVIAHLVGDYFLQSDWMAVEKTKRSVATLVHVITYVIPFFFLTTSWQALAFIVGTHFVIDRFRLARYICWAKNWIGPPTWNKPWSECQATGYTPDKPPYLSLWLMFIVDNTMHVVCNALALRWL